MDLPVFKSIDTMNFDMPLIYDNLSNDDRI